MRLSADKNDPGYNCDLAHDKATTIMLNGEKCDHVVTADEEAGEIVRYVYENGMIKVGQHGEVMTETLRGRVSILFIR